MACPAPNTSTLLAPGARVGRYQIVELLGAGGSGVVYIAHDPELGRRIALKLLHPGCGARLVEAKAMTKLRHPCVVAVHDAGMHGDRVFVAMELVPGETLRHWLRERRPWREVVRVLAAAGQGLAAAHALGIVHRDFKPENVLLGPGGQICVSDFGLALAGAPPDPRADQYSFCLVLHEAVSGGGAPRWLRALVRRGLADDPGARHPSMAALLHRLAERPERARRAVTLLAACALIASTVVAARG